MHNHGDNTFYRGGEERYELEAEAGGEKLGGAVDVLLHPQHEQEERQSHQQEDQQDQHQFKHHHNLSLRLTEYGTDTTRSHQPKPDWTKAIYIQIRKISRKLYQASIPYARVNNSGNLILMLSCKAELCCFLSLTAVRSSPFLLFIDIYWYN